MFVLIFGVVGMALGFSTGILIFHAMKPLFLSLWGGGLTWLSGLVSLGACVISCATIGMLVGYFLGIKADNLWSRRAPQSFVNKDKTEL